MVLVVDDSSVVRMHVRKVLDRAGYVTAEATDGVDALQKLASNPDTKLVVCDVNMPRMDGLEFLQQLRADAWQIPLIFLTPEDEPDLIERAREFGVAAWLRKPLNAELLLATVQRFTVLPG
jgi:two-component system chemotaxis response regulator CheY